MPNEPEEEKDQMEASVPEELTVDYLRSLPGGAEVLDMAPGEDDAQKFEYVKRLLDLSKAVSMEDKLREVGEVMKKNAQELAQENVNDSTPVVPEQSKPEEKTEQGDDQSPKMENVKVENQSSQPAGGVEEVAPVVSAEPKPEDTAKVEEVGGQPQVSVEAVEAPKESPEMVQNPA